MRSGSSDRGRGAPHLVPAVFALACAVAAWLSWGRLASCGTALERPETQVRKALGQQDRALLADVYGFGAGGTVELHGVRFEDVVPSVEKGRATVVAMLSAQGRVTWRDQETALSYLGRERFHMRPCSIALWCGEGDQFERLRGVLTVLFRRQDALRLGDAEAHSRLLSPRYADRGEDRAHAQVRLARELSPGRQARVTAWQIRIERDEAEVGEDREVVPPNQPARRERHVYRLEREEGGRWAFTGGV